MIIKAKYNIGDEVWFMYENKPIQIQIGRIEVYYGYKLNKNGEEAIEKRVVYIDWYGEHRISESKLFPTKEELIKSL